MRGPTVIPALLLLACAACSEGDEGSNPESSRDQTLPSGLVIDLQTSDWQVGDPAEFTGTVVGRLALDAKNCVYLATEDADFYVVWPQGFSAATAQGGSFDLFDRNFRRVASSGDEVEALSGTVPAAVGNYGTSHCGPSSGVVGLIQSMPKVV